MVSHDITVFQWITCNKKCCDHTCIYTFVGTCNVIDNNNVNFQSKYAHFEGDI